MKLKRAELHRRGSMNCQPTDHYHLCWVVVADEVDGGCCGGDGGDCLSDSSDV